MAVILGSKMTEFSLEIAKAVRFHRKQAKLSQKQLSEYAAIGKTAVFDIEHGKPTVRMETLLKVLNILNIKLIIAAPLNYKETNHEKS
jgi:transcriptional regulator with XRE-family HTH domain